MYIHTHIHTYVYTYTHTHADTHTHTSNTCTPHHIYVLKAVCKSKTAMGETALHWACKRGDLRKGSLRTTGKVVCIVKTFFLPCKSPLYSQSYPVNIPGL